MYNWKVRWLGTEGKGSVCRRMWPPRPVAPLMLGKLGKRVTKWQQLGIGHSPEEVGSLELWTGILGLGPIESKSRQHMYIHIVLCGRSFVFMFSSTLFCFGPGHRCCIGLIIMFTQSFATNQAACKTTYVRLIAVCV